MPPPWIGIKTFLYLSIPALRLQTQVPIESIGNFHRACSTNGVFAGSAALRSKTPFIVRHRGHGFLTGIFSLGNFRVPCQTWYSKWLKLFVGGSTANVADRKYSFVLRDGTTHD
jgi:hypothetical protein